jgi:hypothetical protein
MTVNVVHNTLLIYHFPYKNENFFLWIVFYMENINNIHTYRIIISRTFIRMVTHTWKYELIFSLQLYNF